MYKFLIITCLLLFTVSSKINSKENNLLLGSIKNRTQKPYYDNLSLVLKKKFGDLGIFPNTKIDPTLCVDSFPDEPSILNAREKGIDYLLWGEIDSCLYGFSITLKMLDMSEGITTNIKIVISESDKKNEIAEMLCSKLLFWFSRTEMVQLIVSTSPSGASVLMDNSEIGLTPYEGMVKPGTYNLKLIKKPYKQINLPVSFISGNTYQYDFTLYTEENKMDKRSVLRWLGVSLLLGAGGGVAHCLQQRAMENYRAAKPGDNFDHLYRKALVWNVTRGVLWGSAGLSFGRMVIKAVF